MKRWLQRLFGTQAREDAELREVPRDEVQFLMMHRDGVPMVDWHMAEAWIEKRTEDPVERSHLHRAVAARWLDNVRDSLDGDYQRWRHARVEGLALMERNVAVMAAASADRAIAEIESALKPILRGVRIPPVAVIALDSNDSYLTFTSPFYADEGEFATSGGVYIRAESGSFPMIAFPAIRGHGVAAVVAHEMTHHALSGIDIPLWVEEGLTQMMEERVEGSNNFTLNSEMVERHQARWSESGLERFWSGETFFSPHEDEQELSYHLAQLLVRSQLRHDPKRFFAFVQDCRDNGAEASIAANVPGGLDDVVWRLLGGAP